MASLFFEKLTIDPSCQGLERNPQTIRRFFFHQYVPEFVEGVSPPIYPRRSVPTFVVLPSCWSITSQTALNSATKDHIGCRDIY